MLLGTLDWEDELSPEPAGWRLSHEQLVNLLDQWEEITTDMKGRWAPRSCAVSWCHGMVRVGIRLD